MPFRDDVNSFFSDIKIARIELRKCKGSDNFWNLQTFRLGFLAFKQKKTGIDLPTIQAYRS